MDTSAFGVEHVTKAAELDSPASAHLEAHDHGWHADKPHPDCDRCMNPAARHRAVVRTQSILRRAR